MRFTYSLLVILALSQPVLAGQLLTGKVEQYDVDASKDLIKLRAQKVKADPRAKSLTGKVQFEHLRGYIGAEYEKSTGKLTYIYGKSDLNKFGIKAGDYIIKIEKEDYRPCVMPEINFWPVNSIMQFTIRKQNGQIVTIPIKLVEAKLLIKGK